MPDNPNINLLIVVPARGGSKRLPGKNTADLGGIPLIAHTVRFLKNEGLLENAIVSTDDDAIADAARSAGLSVPFMRPAALASDTATTLSVIIHALEHQEHHTGSTPELVAIAQPTSPFRRKGLLRDAISLLNENPSAASVVAMAKLHVPADYVFKEGKGGALQSLTHERPNSDAAYVPTGSLYVTRTRALRGQNTIYAQPTLMIEVSQHEAIDIDTQADFRIASALIVAGPAT